MKVRLLYSFLLVILSAQACTSTSPLEGKWEYDGGRYNGKIKKAEPGFTMQRTYSLNSYEAFLIESGAEPVKYGAGKYELKADSFFVTSTFSNQPSQSLGKTIKYRYKIDGKKLIITGVLPNGMQVEEYWKKLD